jgi:hypothetical protein
MGRALELLVPRQLLLLLLLLLEERRIALHVLALTLPTGMAMVIVAAAHVPDMGAGCQRLLLVLALLLLLDGTGRPWGMLGWPLGLRLLEGVLLLLLQGVHVVLLPNVPDCCCKGWGPIAWAGCCCCCCTWKGWGPIAWAGCCCCCCSCKGWGPIACASSCCCCWC